MSRRVALVALASLVVGCSSATDPCSAYDQTTTCIGLIVTGVAGQRQVDQIAVSGVVGFSFDNANDGRSPTTPQLTQLPVALPILPPSSFHGGAFVFDVRAYLDGRLIGDATAGGAVNNGEHTRINVTLGPPNGTPPESITITPPTATVMLGQTVQFSANAPVLWGVEEGSSGGTVDGTGLYTAPGQSGTYHVVAMSKFDITVRATATIIVGNTTVTAFVGIPDDGIDDGTGAAARFNQPSGVASDGQGNLFVSDLNNSTIRKIVIATGAVTTYAGHAREGGISDGPVAQARFQGPGAILADHAGSLFVLESYSGRVRKIDLGSDTVSTLGGGFNGPQGFTLDGGTLYVADTQNCAVRKMAVTGGTVSIVAGMPGTCGYLDGTGSAARFSQLLDIAADGHGNLFVLDNSTMGGVAIRKIVISSGVVTTFTGPKGGYADGVGANAAFNYPKGIVSDGTNLYVADGNNNIRMVTLTNATVTTLVGPNTLAGGDYISAGFADGNGTAARFAQPQRMAFDTGALFVADTQNFAIRRVDVATKNVTTVAGMSSRGSIDGAGASARFNRPTSLAADPTGTYVFVADADNAIVRRITVATGDVSTIGGIVGQHGGADGPPGVSRFSLPLGVAATAATVYVADGSYMSGQTIRAIDIISMQTTTLAGTAGMGGAIDGVGTAARFSNPQGLALDDAGNLFIADTGACTIRQLRLSDRTVTTLAGTATMCATTDGTGAAARFSGPSAIAADAKGHLFVTQPNDHVVRRIDVASRAVTTFAGTSGANGTTDGTGAGARFGYPRGIVSDGMSTLYVAEQFGGSVRKIDTNSAQVTTAVGTHKPYFEPAPLPGTLAYPSSVALLPNGDLLIGDEFENFIALAHGL